MTQRDPAITSPICQYRRIVLLTDGASNPFLAKTAISMLRYRGDDVCAILDRSQAGQTAEELFGCGGRIPVVGSLREVESADALLIGIAPPGGRLPDEWRPFIMDAIGLGLDIVAGLHQFMADDEEISTAAAAAGVRLIDVRRNSFKQMPTLVERNPGCFCVLTVGQDCSVGKMVTAIEVGEELKRRGLDAGFAATGQTGIMISGSGMPVDCVISDFVNAAAEQLVLENQHFELLMVEGQGCITHPAYSAVTMGLLHGAAPDAMVLCFEAGRTHVKGFGEVPLQPLARLVQIYEDLASTRRSCRVVGVSMNSRLLDEDHFREEKARIESELGLPVCDVYREGPERLADAILEARKVKPE